MRLTIPGITVGLLVACVAADAATAQDRPALHAGARLRVWHRNAIPREVTVGTLLTFDPYELSLVPRGAIDPTTVRFAAIDYLEISRGRDPLVRFGIPALGALLGAWVAPRVMTEPRGCNSSLVSASRCIKETPDWLVGAGGGLIVFGVLGSFIGRERWTEVPVASLAPGPIVSVSLSF